MLALTLPRVSRAGLGVAAACLVLGMSLGLFLLVSSGQMRGDGAYSEIVYRTNDFMNYGRMRAMNWAEHLHPVYAILVKDNNTAPAIIAAFLQKITGSELPGRWLLTALYEGLFGLALPLFFYSVTKRAGWAIAISAVMYVITPSEWIYNYSSVPITGNLATGLFFVELALLYSSRIRLAALVWVFHLWAHPTTAVMWAPPLVGFLAMQDGLAARLALPQAFKPARDLVLRRPAATIGVGAVGLGVCIFLAELAGIVMSGVDAPSYWAIIRTRTLHTVFLGNERAFLLVVYLQLALSVGLLGTLTSVDKRLTLINRLAAAYALGLFATSLMFVEMQASVAVAATLPLRFAVVLYALILVNILVIASNSRQSTAARIGAVGTFLLFLPGSPAAPLLGIFAWAIFQRSLDHQTNWKVAAIQTAATAAVAFILTLALPSHDSMISSWYLNGLWSTWQLAAAPVAGAFGASTLNAKLALLLLQSVLAVGLVVFICALCANRRVALLSFGAIALLAASANSAPSIARQYDWSSFAREIRLLDRSSGDASDLLVQWMRRTVPPGAAILADPQFQLRREIPNQVTLDDDILSLIPYVPRTAKAAVDEYRAVYEIDLIQAAREHQRIWSVIDNAAWVRARDRALQDGEYEWVVERSLHPSAGHPAFENTEYRVYHVAKPGEARRL